MVAPNAKKQVSLALAYFAFTSAAVCVGLLNADRVLAIRRPETDGNAITPGPDPKLDPKLGVEIDLAKNERVDISEWQRKPTETAGGATQVSDVLLVAMGSCSSCSLNTIVPSSIDHGRYKQVIYLYMMDEIPQEVPRYWRYLPSNASVLKDNDSTIHRTLNAVVPPRYYLLDSSSRLKAISPADGKQPAFVHFLSKAEKVKP